MKTKGRLQSQYFIRYGVIEYKPADLQYQCLFLGILYRDVLGENEALHLLQPGEFSLEVLFGHFDCPGEVGFSVKIDNLNWVFSVIKKGYLIAFHGDSAVVFSENRITSHKGP